MVENTGFQISIPCCALVLLFLDRLILVSIQFQNYDKLKTIRSTMANDRLTGLALLNVHYEKEIDIDRLIDVFASKFKHSLILGDIIDEKPS